MARAHEASVGEAADEKSGGHGEAGGVERNINGVCEDAAGGYATGVHERTLISFTAGGANNKATPLDAQNAT